MAARQRRLDLGLAFEQPVEGGVELVLVDGRQAERDAQAGGGGRRIERLGRGQLRDRADQAYDDHGDDEIAAAIAGRSQHPVEADPAQRAERRRDVAVRQRPFDGDGGLARRPDGAALEQRPQSLDPLTRPVAEVEQGPLLDLVTLAIALAQEDGRRRAAVGDRLDIHGRSYRPGPNRCNHKINIYMATPL